MNKIKRPFIIYIGIWAVVFLLNVVAWNSTAFCDAYIKYVFPVWVNTYGRIMGLAPFSVGELLLGLGILLTVLAAILWIPLFISAVRAGVFGKIIRRFYGFVAWVVLAVCLVMTLNCFVLYHATPFSETHFGKEKKEYGLEDLIAVRNMVVEECNRLSLVMERDGEGAVIYGKDMRREAIACMQKLGETYEQLDGFYPVPKPLYTSDFFCQQHICGYYFPFSLEANYNDVMYLMNKPATMCHELAHLRGYILEDEANFISYLACIQSEDPVFRYSGYLSVLNYLDNDFYRAVRKDRDAYLAQPIISKQVRDDNIFVTQKEWDRINGEALIDTEVVKKASDTLVDTTLKVNGVTDGIVSYSRVVELLLQYYGTCRN